MILRRIALFFGLLLGLGATQVPEFVQQYRQRLGGAVDELARVVSRFDDDAIRAGSTGPAALARLQASSDPIAQERGTAMAEDKDRLQSLRTTQAALRDAAPVARIGVAVAHLDPAVARGTMAEFAPAVPTSTEAFTLGAVGFVLGSGLVHTTGHLFRRRLRTARA